MKEKVTAFSKKKGLKDGRLAFTHNAFQNKMNGGGDIYLQSGLRCIKLLTAKMLIWDCYPSQLI